MDARFPQRGEYTRYLHGESVGVLDDEACKGKARVQPRQDQECSRMGEK